MEITTTAIVTLCLTVVQSLLAFGHYHPSADKDKIMYWFSMVPCSSQHVGVVLKGSSFLQEATDSLLSCGISCLNSDTNCSFAIRRQSTKTCKHIDKYDGNNANPSPSYANENGCFVLRRQDKPICQNGGNFPGKYTCQCPDGFTGRECEEARPTFCEPSPWRGVEPSDWRTVSTSMFQMKMVRHYGLSAVYKQISNVNYFIQNRNGIRFQYHNFLSVDTAGETFESELKREFNHYSGETETLTTMKMTMPGTVTSTPDTEFHSGYSLLVRDVLDSNRLVYQAGVQGTLSDLVDGLYAGHRVTFRCPTRTKFNRQTGNVITQRPTCMLGSDGMGLRTPLYHYILKHSIKLGRRYRAMWYLGGGGLKLSKNTEKSFGVELDRCWVKMASLTRNEGMLSLLREAVLNQGLELRLIMAASVSADVTMVTVADLDVIVTLADYLTTSENDTLDLYRFKESSKIRLSLVSLSNTLAECDMTFEGSDVNRINHGSPTSGLEWVVSSRTWKKTLEVTSTGTAISGSHDDVYSGALMGKNVRVCIEMTTGVSVCFTGTSVDLNDNSRHAMIQSHPSLGVGLNPDTTFSGLVDSDCKRTAYLASTKGWVKSATYVIGQADPPGAIALVDVLKTTWFCQD